MSEAHAIDVALDLIRTELEKATKRFGSFHSAHEGLAVIEEEFLELREVVFWPHKVGDVPAQLQELEAKQLGAMAARFLVDVIIMPALRERQAGDGI